MINIDKVVKNNDVINNIKFLCDYSSNTSIDYYMQELIVDEIINAKVPGYEFITNVEKAWDIVEGLCSCMEALFDVYYDKENNEILCGTIIHGVHSGCVTEFGSLPLKEGTDLYYEWEDDQEMFDIEQIDWDNFKKIIRIHSHPTGMISPSLPDILCDQGTFGICGNLNNTCRFKTYIPKFDDIHLKIPRYNNYSSSYLFTPQEELLMYEADVDTFSETIYGVVLTHLNIYNEKDTKEIEKINEATLNDYYSIKEYKI